MTLKLQRYVGNRVSCDAQIAEAGQRMATAREGMTDRIADANANGKSSQYFLKGCWYQEGTARIDGRNYWCLGQFAPTTKYAQKTFEANANGRGLALTEDIKLGRKPAKEIIKQIAEEDADRPTEQKRVLVPKNQDSLYIIQTNDFGNQDVPVFLARRPELAQAYGEMLKNVFGIDSVNIRQLSGSEDIAAGLWLYRFGDGNDSCFNGSNRNFHGGFGSSFGVCRRARSASASAVSTSGAQKNLGYSPKLVRRAVSAELRARMRGFEESVLARLANLKQ